MPTEEEMEKLRAILDDPVQSTELASRAIDAWAFQETKSKRSSKTSKTLVVRVPLACERVPDRLFRELSALDLVLSLEDNLKRASPSVACAYAA